MRCLMECLLHNLFTPVTILLSSLAQIRLRVFGFSRQKGSNILTDEAVYGSYLLHINIFYRTNPKNIESQTISLIISHGSPYNIAVQSILHSISSEKIKISHIYKTSVTIADMHNESNNTETYAAIFSYKNVGYILSAENGVTQTDFINVLTSIIKS
jgi:hypothetical protein